MFGRNRAKPEEKIDLLARICCQLFGNLLAVFERAAAEKEPDYATVLLYAVAVASLNFHSKNIRSREAPEMIERANHKAARSIARSLHDEARIDDARGFYEAYMSRSLGEFSAGIETLVLDVATGKDAAARELALRYAEEAAGLPQPIPEAGIDDFVDQFEDRLMTASRVVMKHL